MRSQAYTAFELELRNTRTNRTKRVRFKIEKHPLAQRWAKMLRDLLESNAYLEKNYLFHGWRNKSRDIHYLCRTLNKHVGIINQYYSEKPHGQFYKIDQIFSPPVVSREDLNLIHHHFEVLIGQAWNVSEYYKKATPQVRHSIAQLNNLCHEIENLQRHKSGRCESNLFFSFLKKPTQELKPSDRKYFDLRLRFGDVKLHYAQLGKTHLEAFTDNDTDIFDSNISELRYLSGEFDISLTDENPYPIYKKSMDQFKDWLMNKGVDIKKHNIGFARIAKLDRSLFKGMSNLDILNELFKFDDISAIHLRKGRKVISNHFPYHWTDPDDDERQIQFQTRDEEDPFVVALKNILKKEFPDKFPDSI